MKQTFLKTTLLLLITIVFTNCNTEEVIPEQQKTIETVSVSEALNLFNTPNSKTSSTSKSNNEQYATPNLDKISYEEIKNSNELLTIIPATIKEDNFYSRILLLKIDGEIQSVIFNMFLDEPTTNSDFSGKVFIMDLEGNFINGYKIENNIFISQYQKVSNFQSKTNNTLSKISGDDCPYEDDNLCSLEEVVITASSGGPTSINEPQLQILFGTGGSSYDYTWDPWPGSGGGGSSSIGCSDGYIKDSNGNCVVITCAEGYAKDDNGNCVINPLFGADCRSFEYAQPPGALQKACAVTNFGNNFYYGFFRSNGSWEVGYFPTNYPLIYFTMPPFMTNGQAANLTAEAVTAATRITDVYVLANADGLSEQEVRNEFLRNVKNAMSLVGGSIKQTAPFAIPSPAPYLTSLLGVKTDCN